MDVGKVLAKQGRRYDWFAVQLGITPSHVTRLLNGERPWTPKLRRKAADALGVPEDVLFLDLAERGERVESP